MRIFIYILSSKYTPKPCLRGLAKLFHLFTNPVFTKVFSGPLNAAGELVAGHAFVTMFFFTVVRNSLRTKFLNNCEVLNKLRILNA